jgi:putative DNA primase/helicase
MRSRLEAAIILAQSEIALSDSGKNWNVETTKQCVFLCYGNGANGKSTFLEALRYTLGDYAHNIPFSTLELEGRTSIPNDVAGLVGRRFVTAIETNDSVRLNEARLKALTGCDAISARHLYQDFFTFVPVAKFWLAFNHKPVVQDNSHALWRRLKPIPFTQTFEAGTEDKNLLATLKKEAKGILSWAVEGFRLYQVEGLDEPTAVTIPY